MLFQYGDVHLTQEVLDTLGIMSIVMEKQPQFVLLQLLLRIEQDLRVDLVIQL